MLDATGADLKAEQSWYALADMAGIDDSRCSFRRFRAKDAPGGGTMILQVSMDGKPAFALKQFFNPAGGPPVSRWATAQNAAKAAMDGTVDAGAEAFVWSDADEAILSEWIEGEVVDDLLFAQRLDPAARHRTLRRAGAWLSRLHRQTLVECTAFNPAFLKRKSADLRAGLNNGVIDLPRPGWFRRFARAFAASAEAVAQRPTHSAVLHGNFRMENLMLDEAHACGLGFRSPNKTVTVAHDVAQFLVDFAATHVPHADMQGGAIMAAADIEAFFAGYDLLDPDDPVLGYLIDAKILADWSVIPGRFDSRSIAQQQRLQGIKHMVWSRLGDA